VGYVDSSGLATLVEYVRLAQDFGGKLGLLNVSERVRTIFDLVRLTEFLPIFPTFAEARAALLAVPGA
jgi:anti-sigma B factor antagonist